MSKSYIRLWIVEVKTAVLELDCSSKITAGLLALATASCRSLKSPACCTYDSIRIICRVVSIGEKHDARVDLMPGYVISRALFVPKFAQSTLDKVREKSAVNASCEKTSRCN